MQDPSTQQPAATANPPVMCITQSPQQPKPMMDHSPYGMTGTEYSHGRTSHHEGDILGSNNSRGGTHRAISMIQTRCHLQTCHDLQSKGTS